MAENDMRYIYPYNRVVNGRTVLQGWQVRFKRVKRNGEPENLSCYFGISNVGSEPKARKAAKAWRDQNERWMEDRSFKPKLLKKDHGRVQVPRRHGRHKAAA